VNACAPHDIPDIYADPEFNLPICWNLRIALNHRALDLHGATQRVRGADKQDQQSVASRPYDPTTVFLKLGFYELSMMSVQLGESAFIVDAY
jgi:hypothetical protein